MRILFVGGYQGDKLIHARNIVRNRSLAGTNKIRAICSALASRGHEVSIYSTGRAAERTGRWYSAMRETIPVIGGNDINVWYGESLDVKCLGGLVSDCLVLKWLPRIFGNTKFDAAFVYNLGLETIVASLYCRVVRKIPVILEYEDSVVAIRYGPPPFWKKPFYLFEWAMSKIVGGVYAPSPELTETLRIDNKMVVPGALSSDLVAAAMARASHTESGGRLKVLYCGNLDCSKGVDLLMKAVELVEYPLEIHICGKGPLETELRDRCAKCRHPAYFHGVVSNAELIKLQTSTDIAVNPHRISWHKGTVWPFKVVEYLASCGVVICARTGRIEKDLEEHLHMYQSDDPVILANTIKEVIGNWENEQRVAPERMSWAIKKWGPEGMGQTMEQLLLNARVSLRS